MCNLHGGKSPVGPASPKWVDGHRSIVLPARLRERQLAAMNDPNKLAMETELAVIDARIQDVAERVDTGESGRLWTKLRAAWVELGRARRSGDPSAILEATRQVGDLITAGHQDYQAWTELLGLIDRRQRVVESERKRLIEARQVITLDAAMAVIDLLVDSVHQHVRDPDALDAIITQYVRLTGVARPVEAPASAIPQRTGRRGTKAR